MQSYWSQEWENDQYLLVNYLLTFYNSLYSWICESADFTYDSAQIRTCTYWFCGSLTEAEDITYYAFD